MGCVTAALLTATAVYALYGRDAGTSTTGSAAVGDGPGFTVAAGGDILIHPEVTAQAVADAKASGKGNAPDFTRVMAGLKPTVSRADLAICHMETVVAPPEGPFLGYRDFNVPPQIVDTVAGLGYDTCSTASNHTLDHGPEGVQRTLAKLDEAGLEHTGSARSAAEAARPLIVDVDGVKVGQLSYSYGFNDTEVPEDKPWLANEIDVGRIVEDERALREAGVDVVIASLHWGREKHNEASRTQRDIARSIAEKTGIDLVLGHHAHVVQPFEKIGDTWIAYGLGNQVAKHLHPLGTTEEGVLGWFRFTEEGGDWGVSAARYVPTLVELRPKIRVVDVVAELREGEGDLPAQRRARLWTAYERTRGVLFNKGAGDDGLRPLKTPPSR